MSFADLPVAILGRLCTYLDADDICRFSPLTCCPFCTEVPYVLEKMTIAQSCRLAAVAQHTRVAAQAAELHFPTDEARLTGRREAMCKFALQNADRVVRLGSLTAVEDNLPSLFSPGNLEQLAAFRRLAGLYLDFPVSVDDFNFSYLPRSLRSLDLSLKYG